MSLRSLATAVLFAALVPFAASAATVDVLEGDISFDATTMTGTITVPGAARINLSFEAGHPGGTALFTIDNVSTTPVLVEVVSYTVQQGGSAYGFFGGVDVWFDGNLVESVPQGGTSVGQPILNTVLGAGVDSSFSFEYGAAFGSLPSDLDLGIVATAIPIPAAGFLLLGALGGLAAVRRKDS